MVLIKLNNLTLGYKGKAVLENLNLEIQKGDFVCIVGPNGAGKSTLIKGILGLLKPMAGEVIYQAMERNLIGYVPQETKVEANFPASVEEIVLSGTLNRMGRKICYGERERRRALESLELLGLEKLKEKSFGELSGGQKQKVLLARSLAATKELLVLDEPSNNLDKKSRKELYQLLEKLNVERGITVMMVTHDLDHGNLIGNKILSLGSEEVFYGTTAEFVRRVHHE